MTTTIISNVVRVEKTKSWPLRFVDGDGSWLCFQLTDQAWEQLDRIVRRRWYDAQAAEAMEHVDDERRFRQAVGTIEAGPLGGIPEGYSEATGTLEIPDMPNPEDRYFVSRTRHGSFFVKDKVKGANVGFFGEDVELTYPSYSAALAVAQRLNAEALGRARAQMIVP